VVVPAVRLVVVDERLLPLGLVVTVTPGIQPQRPSRVAGVGGVEECRLRCRRGERVGQWLRVASLRRRLDAVAGPDPAAREHVGPQPAPVHEAAQHPGPR
jgi:hypothetical protein